MSTTVDAVAPLTDADLVRMARSGDRTAFDELVQRHYRSCVAIADFMLRDRAEAEDEVQKACWKAFEHLDQYQGTAEFPAWLIRIVENGCLMMMRLRRRARFLYIDGVSDGTDRASIELPATAEDPELELVKHELAEHVRREMRRLPRLLREVIILRDIEELPMAQVAERLEISVAAAKSRLLRARGELRARALRYCGPNGAHMSRSAVRTLPARPVQGRTWVA